MIATHSIKINGVWYHAGMKIPAVTNDKNEHMETFTKTDIHRMPIAELRKLASEKGVNGFMEMNGAELKKILIEKIGK